MKKTNVFPKSHLVIVIVMLLLFSVSCGGLYQPTLVEFDDASAYCKESRALIVIESKMIPTDEALSKKAQEKTAEGAVVEADPAAKTNYMLIDEDAAERFLTIPDNRFSAVTFENGKHLVYWIHLVSSDEATLDEIEENPSRVYKIVNNILVRFHQSGQLKTAGIESEINDAILKELQSSSRTKKVVRVFIHLGC